MIYLKNFTLNFKIVSAANLFEICLLIGSNKTRILITISSWSFQFRWLRLAINSFVIIDMMDTTKWSPSTFY